MKNTCITFNGICVLFLTYPPHREIMNMVYLMQNSSKKYKMKKANINKIKNQQE